MLFFSVLYAFFNIVGVKFYGNYAKNNKKVLFLRKIRLEKSRMDIHTN